MGTTDNPAPVMIKVYRIHSAYWDGGYAADHRDDAIEAARSLFEDALDHGEKETVTITTDEMDEEEYKALPEFQGW